MKKINALLLLLFLSICALSCSKEDPVVDNDKPGNGTVTPTPSPTPTPTPSPEPLPSETISSSYVSYDFEKSEVLACDTASGNYSLRFDADVPDITAGSVVYVKTDSTNYVILVTKASTKDKVVDMTGVIGDLSYVFFNTEFTLQTGTMPTTKAYSGNVYYPQEYYTTRATWNYTLWSTSVHEENDLYKSAKSRIWTEADFNASLNATLTFEFGSPIKNVIDGVEFMRAGNYTVDASITGGYDASYDLYMNYSDKGEVNLHPKDKDKYALLKHNLFPQKSVIFPVGGVPVPVTFSSDLYADVSLPYEGKLDFNTGISASVSGTLGLKYDAINNSGLTLYNELTLGYERRDPSLTGYGKVEGKCHIFPRVRACIGGAVGPSLDIKPYAKVSLEGGFKETLGGSSSDYLASLVKTFVGLDAAVGISTTFFNYENWNLSTPDVNIFEAQLFESPVEIEFLEAKKLSNRSYDVSFKVSDRYFDGNNYTSILWPIVNFEAEGTLSSKFVFSEQGVATVNWMPKKRPSKIYARIYNPDGSVIDEAEYECEEEDDIRDYLVRLYQTAGGDNWYHNEGWCSDLPVEEWYGVNFYNGLYTLYFGYNNLSGYIDVSGCTSLESLSCEHNNLTTLDVSGCTSLEVLGCEHNNLTTLDVSGCTSLEHLYCGNNSLTTLDASGCTSLEELECQYNSLTTLDVSGCTSLEELECQYNSLTTLDVSGFTSLEVLGCEHNNLTSLDVSGCTSLEILSCDNNNLTALDVSGCSSLKILHCHDNNLSDLGVSGCTLLKELWCSNNNFTTLDVSGCTSLLNLIYDYSTLTILNAAGCTSLLDLYCPNNNLTTLDVSGCTSLVFLSCDNNNLTTLDVSGCTSLEQLWCEHNNLSTLDVSGCTSLKQLWCGQNNLTTLDVSGCTSLEQLWCGQNNLTTLDVSGCTSLEYLHCSLNNLTTLDVSGCTLLKELWCSNNNFTTLDVSGCTSLEFLSCDNNNLTTLEASGCTSLEHLSCKHNKLNKVIEGIFSSIKNFIYDQKYYNYEHYRDHITYKTNAYGWWYPGEPERGYHKK